MSVLLHYLCIGLDYLLSFLLLGIGQAVNLLPRCAGEPVIPDTPGFRIVEEMGPGWNLAGTLESFYENDTGVGLETSWGNPVTTQAMLDMVQEMGFTCVRIPVTWGNHFIDGQFTIDPAWMARVQEVVDYAYNIGLYVILNAHNDDYYGYTLDPALEARTVQQYTRIWAQISARFAAYGCRLLFEAINEPKVVDSLLAWNGGTVAQRQVLNRLNAAFVATVRAGDSENKTRWLLLPTHAASYDPLAMRAFRLPEGDDRLIVSIHAYYPWEFAGAGAPDKTGYTAQDKKALDTMLGRIYDTFVRRGIPVYLGEFGCVDKNNLADRLAYAKDYVTIARRYGMFCAWWDNSLLPEEEYNGASFALLNRRALVWYQPELAKAMVDAARG
ncbi:MAG: glycoside hydrolase family 5 protein [Oscillospiraceae bacterium]|jgi:endoglucanase|nr:glycoside hydrolase family 5 protein [Oscillospiraceae bacterium]